MWPWAPRFPYRGGRPTAVSSPRLPRRSGHCNKQAWNKQRRHMMKSLGCLGLVAFTVAAIAASQAGAEDQLTIASAGGAWQQAQRNAWYAPFAQKMGIKFNEEETSAGMARVQAMVQAHNVTDDVVTVDTAQVLAACDSSILVKLDWNKIAPRDSFLPGAARDCGMGLDV